MLIDDYIRSIYADFGGCASRVLLIRAKLKYVSIRNAGLYQSFVDPCWKQLRFYQINTNR